MSICQLGICKVKFITSQSPQGIFQKQLALHRVYIKHPMSAGIQLHFSFENQKLASAAFRFVSEQYVFYSFEQVSALIYNLT